MADDVVPDRPRDELGTLVEWWPASNPDTPPVNMVVLSVAHHNATGHPGGGGGDQYLCDECDFAVDEGVVLSGGWVRWKDESSES